MGRPRKQQNRYLPENLRPKAVTRKSGKTVIYWLYRTHGKTEISLGTNRNEAFLKAAQLNIERESKTPPELLSDLLPNVIEMKLYLRKKLARQKLT
ncbi:TPA: phage integrase Arm DNA-binding domain-containing protein [Mannheimia haemolytica]|nr:phage integrase Arm DNA-binding domain-containing protein [Mannheimia haemolytica]HDL1122934.1 phage integrase Arm DNA-binding domain-containing protein [Mannheimia haemolytica]HDL1141540.1 phage integrase Arm DNA-binding domain-containing protein [Mannheimia haemolytica]HDL1145391.1 phage integrase Arm DNA-binding domain-containing protein [Mannheimia haemolytica]HDL1158074.1 phage integrase Arm DNA-binding domain-containing protein [Mannheimia haemolytica]